MTDKSIEGSILHKVILFPYVNQFLLTFLQTRDIVFLMGSNKCFRYDISYQLKTLKIDRKELFRLLSNSIRFPNVVRLEIYCCHGKCIFLSGTEFKKLEEVDIHCNESVLSPKGVEINMCTIHSLIVRSFLHCCTVKVSYPTLRKFVGTLTSSDANHFFSTQPNLQEIDITLHIDHNSVDFSHLIHLRKLYCRGFSLVCHKYPSILLFSLRHMEALELSYVKCSVVEKVEVSFMR